MLSVENIHFSIHGTAILNGVDFKVSAGETVGVIGPNGSGKTTLFNCLSGFHQPQQGTITFCEKNILQQPPHERAELGIGRIFQNAGIFREMTILENLLVAIESRQKTFRGRLPWGNLARANRELGLEHLERIGLADRPNVKASSLSGGQMRLLEIVRTLAYGAELFLLDEPTAGVSPKMKDNVIELLLHLKNLKKTIIVIEHDINFIQRFCERILVMESGRIVLDGAPDRVRSDPMLQEVYFGSNSKFSESKSA